jgi:Flp pilus assembly protein TadG
MKTRRLARNSSGQALVETALIMPLMLIVVLNAVNFAFFFLMALNITAASRTSGIYSVMGGATPASQPLPVADPPTTASTVSYLAYQDLTGSVSTPSTSNTGINVCSSALGGGTSGTGSATVTTCTGTTGIGGGFPTSAEADPEAPSFLLARVDVAYKFTPPIPVTPFTIFLGLAPNCNAAGTSCTFYRHIVMREMQ